MLTAQAKRWEGVAHPVCGIARGARLDFPALEKHRLLRLSSNFLQLGDHKSHLWMKRNSKVNDEDGIRTHACRAHWISSPTP